MVGVCGGIIIKTETLEADLSERSVQIRRLKD